MVPWRKRGYSHGILASLLFVRGLFAQEEPSKRAGTEPVSSAPANSSAETSEDAPQAPADKPVQRQENASNRSLNQVSKPEAINTAVPPILGTWNETEVILLLAINSDGVVTSAELVSGSEPFSSAALAATPDWKFKPAYKDGTPVASKIRFLLTFSPSSAEEKTAKDPSTTNESQEAPPSPEGAAQAQATGQTLEEVIVLGTREDPGSTSLSRAEVRNLAGAFDDPLRSVEIMPGVTPIASGLPLFFIRGAPPGNVGYFIDGIKVPLLYHAFLGPSVIHPAFIQEVTLNAGPVPTRFGRVAGATVEAKLAQPEGALRGEASLRLIDAGAFVEAPFAGGRGYALVGGRYSYTALLLSAFSPGTRLDYWDYQGLFGYALGRQDELSLLTLGAFDYIGQDGEAVGGTEFHRIDLRWGHRFSANTESRLALTWGRDRTRAEQGFLSDNVLGSRFKFEHRTDDAVFRAGAEVWVDNYDMDVDPAIAEPEIYDDLFPPRTDTSGGVWVDMILFPRGRIQVIPGVRTDFYSSLGAEKISVDPRIFAEYQLTPTLKAIHGIGLAHQTPNFVPNVPGAQVAGLDGGLQETLHASTKYKAKLPWELHASLAFFLNSTQNLTDPIGLEQTFSIDETSEDARSYGRAAGIEIYLERPLTRNIGGLLSYTFSRSLRTYDTIKTVPGYDRPHVLNAAVSYDFGSHFRASARGSIASGIPGRNTTVDGFVFDRSRSAPYVRLDLKLSKRWYISETFFWGAHIEVLNATYTGNVTRRLCTVETCTNEGTAPITFPSIGVEASWQ